MTQKSGQSGLFEILIMPFDMQIILNFSGFPPSGEREGCFYCGFAGHEYLPWFKLYNMNGRLYDPVVGRFLEPDPVIQNAFSTRNLNRYSYGLNNPLKYTDPSGWVMNPGFNSSGIIPTFICESAVVE